jgi:hypothetical protein
MNYLLVVKPCRSSLLPRGNYEVSTVSVHIPRDLNAGQLLLKAGKHISPYNHRYKHDISSILLIEVISKLYRRNIEVISKKCIYGE